MADSLITRCVYAAEDRIERWRARSGPISVFGTTWDVEAETYFARDAAQDLLDRLTTHRGLPPVRLIGSNGLNRASYSTPGRVRIPTAGWGDTSGKARISLIVLTHELTHHVIHHQYAGDAGDGDPHGAQFVAAHASLLRDLDQPISATLLPLVVQHEKDTSQ